MNASVLVLNQDYSPITVCTVQRAFILVLLEKADLLNEVKGKHLHSITHIFAYPSVIRLNNYVKIPYKGVVMSRHNIFKRDGGQCQYCGTTHNLTIDHLVPRSKGGKSTWTNLITACKKCNSRKGHFPLEKVGMNLFKKPEKPTYLSFLKMNHKIFRNEWASYFPPAG